MYFIISYNDHLWFLPYTVDMGWSEMVFFMQFLRRPHMQEVQKRAY